MPGTRAKQAKALAYNIKWMADTFGVERVGFLTLTVGDMVNGRFQKVHSRDDAERRFNSILNRIRERYKCGVIVTERHKDGAVHYHLVVLLAEDVKTGFDFAAVKRRDYRSASDYLRAEWAWWRENQSKYGFGRHELTPVKSNGEAIGRYVGKYLGKSWDARKEEDKGRRNVRYFGRWSSTGAKCGPPMSCRFGAMTEKAQAWRACLKQVQLATRYHGVELNEQNIKEFNGPRWAWRITKQLQRHRFFIPRAGPEAVRRGLETHNEEAEIYKAHVGESRLDNWIEDPFESFREWQYEYCGGSLRDARRRAGDLAEAEKWRLFREVVDILDRKREIDRAFARSMEYFELQSADEKLKLEGVWLN